MRYRYPLLVASFALLANCGDSGPGGDSGTFSFDYGGPISGNFHAQGAMPLFGGGDRPWAVGIRDDVAGTFGVAGVSPTTQGRYHLVAFSISRLTPGTETVDVDCSGDTASQCSGLVIFFEFNENTGESTYLCGLETGTLVLSSISDNRASGTFSGSGFCFDPVGDQVPGFTVANGTFNVPVRNANEFE